MQLLRVPAHRTVMSKFIKVPSTQEMLGKYWLCPLDVGCDWATTCRHGWLPAGTCAPHTAQLRLSSQVFRDLNFTTGFSPFLLYSMLGVWGSYQCRARESRRKGSISPCVVKVRRMWEVSRAVLRKKKKKTEPEIEVEWQGTNKGKPVWFKTIHEGEPPFH